MSELLIPATRPDHHEAEEYYFKYIDLAPAGDIRAVLDGQLSETLAVLQAIPEDASLHRYAPGKWTIRQVVSHVNDTERVFAFRALWFARGFEAPLPSFDQEVAIQHADADARPWTSHVEEFRSVRLATADLFRHLPADAWLRRGIANQSAFTVRALAHITVGHVSHHVATLKERYLQR